MKRKLGLNWNLALIGLAGASLLVGCITSGSTTSDTQGTTALSSGSANGAQGEQGALATSDEGTEAKTHGKRGPHKPCADAPKGNGSLQSHMPPLNPLKVTICHIPPGNPANAHTITVGAPAVRAHLAHGDHLGACVETITVSDCEGRGEGFTPAIPPVDTEGHVKGITPVTPLPDTAFIPG